MFKISQKPQKYIIIYYYYCCYYILLCTVLAPGPPEDIKIAVASAQSLTVAWSPPKYSNGVLLRYNLYTR